ncbi:MAG: lipopolysaccharide transport periplasmic protein LptA [Proteobacteria bacterium]|nr:lipopolysaccharide transport periplasmic protein LptA [Pseudomonadota bacterium]
MSKPFIKQFNSILVLVLVLVLVLTSTAVLALKTDKQEDFILEGDNFKNLPAVNNGDTQIKYWGNVAIEQGTLKIKSNEAIIYNSSQGISKVVLTGKQVTLEQFIDAQYGKINVTADRIDFMIKDDMLLMSGNVSIKSKIQGEMSGEKITMNLKTKEISGVKSENTRVRLIIKPKNSTP